MNPDHDWIPHSRPTLGRAAAAAVNDVVNAGLVGPGDRAREFETRFAAFVGRPYSRATSTGSAALHLALLVAGAKPGVGVLIPAFVCRAVLNVVLSTGATPVLADIDPSDLNVSPEGVSAAIRSATHRPRLMIAVHSFGAPLDLELFSQHGMIVIEDAASSTGAEINGKRVGNAGILSVFSFGSTKMLTTGQGGMVMTDDRKLAERIDELRDYECNSANGSGDIPAAFNYGLSDLQSALGLQQLSEVNNFLARREAVAKKYSASLEGVAGVELPHGVDAPGRRHSYYRYVFLHPDAKTVVGKLRNAGIDARESVAHFLDDYLKTGSRFPGCESVRTRIVSLPIHPSLTDSEVNRVAAAAEAASG